MAHPCRIEDDIEGAQVRAESTGGYSSLMDVLGSGVVPRGTEAPIVVQESGEALTEHGPDDITERRVRAKPTPGCRGGGEPQCSHKFRSALGRETHPFESGRHLVDDLRVSIVKLELDLPEAQAIPRAALHRDGVVIDLGQGVLGRIVEEQTLTGRFQLYKLLERLPTNEPLDDRAGILGISSLGPVQETSVRLSVEPSAAAGNFRVQLPAPSPCVVR